MGRLARKHGLACDNLLSVELVTAEGKVVTASPSEKKQYDPTNFFRLNANIKPDG